MQRQTSTQAPAEAPVVVQVNPGAQLTGQDVQALRVRLRDLRNELQDAAERRNSTASRLGDIDASARPGALARLEVLDTRILSIENEITSIGQQLGRAPPGALVAGTQESPDPARIAERVVDDIVPIIAILSIFVFFPLTIPIGRFFWRRSSPAPRVGHPDSATQQRLENLQQAVDTIAIEVERISEGQRFVTKIMSERPALGAGAAEQIGAARQSAIPSERR